MIDRNTPSDPRLRERRGDLVGLNAILFAGALLVTLAIAAFLIIDFIPGQVAASPTAPGSGGPTATSSASSSPSSSASHSPGPSLTATPVASGSPVAVVFTAIGSETPLVSDGNTVGTVTAAKPERPRRIGGNRPPSGQAWATVEIRYTATAALDYSADQWLIEDANGDRHSIARAAASPALSDGSLAAGENVTGLTTFTVPVGVDIASVILQTPDGQDLVVFTLP